jgi:small-conductance mechanosensitive channel
LLLMLGLSLASAVPVWAQSADESAAPEAIETVARMIRWSGVATSLLVIAGAWILLRFTSRLSENLGEVFVDRRMVFQKLHTFLQFAIYFVTTVSVILLSFQISSQVLALLGGTVALAAGFAFKDLAASIVAGVMIMFDRPFQVGDRVSFGGEYGDVTVIGLRSVKLRTLDDSMVTIPNNIFLNSVTSCGNYGVLEMQTVVDFHIGLDQDAVKARDLVREAAGTSRYIYLGKPIEVLVSQVVVESYVALRVRLKAYVLDTRYEKGFETDVTLRVLDAFREADIHPPAILHRNPAESAGKPAS